MKLTIILVLLAAAGSAAAQTVWRCGGPAATIYSDIPCPDQGREVLVADARSSAEVQAARAVAARESRLAERLAAESQRREASTGPVLVGIRSPAVLVPRSDPAPRRQDTPFTVKLAKSAI